MVEEEHESAFKTALAHVVVPAALEDGVNVLRVKVNGSMRESFLTLSQDRFTLYITSTKVSKSKDKSSSSGSGGGSIFSFGRNSTTSTSSNSSTARLSAVSFETSDMQEHSIDIGAIDRIQRGQATHKFELAKKSRQDSRRNLMSSSTSSLQQLEQDVALYPSKSFSIIFRGARTLDLMMPSDNRDDVLDALDSVLRAYQAAKVTVAKDVLLLRYIWLDVDKEKTNRLNASELAKVFDRINCYMKKQELNKMYEKFAKIMGLNRSERRKGLTFEQCSTFLHKIKRDSWMVKPVNVIWNNLFGEIMNNGKQRMTVSDRTFLQKFLHQKQAETSMTLADVQRLFSKLHRMEMPHTQQGAQQQQDVTRIDKNQFEAYLLSSDNDAFDPCREAYDARLMTKPISEYWINTSHNTYLTGDQFTSHSSVEMYMNALYRGCRCLELDIWDGEYESNGGSGSGNNTRPIPVVWHGHTMTSKILFVDILQCFRVFLNFHPDTYPLVLSFENHCTIPFQEVMAEDLDKVLGDKLYIPTEASLFGRLPSPEDMRGLVVIKGRRPNGTMDDYGSDEESDDDDIVSNTGTEKTSRSAMSGSASQQPKKKIVTKISPLLARLTLFHGCKLKNWDVSVRNPTYHMHSFTETKIKKMCRQSTARKWAIYNQSHMSRTYPAGSRVDSSNYSPMLAWSTGCQLVALNFQTPDPPLKLNDGRFRENGNCGYVLKPSSLMMKDDFSPTAVPVKLSVRVVSGSCLPKPKGQRSGDCINPLVKISVYDVENDEKDTCTTFSTTAVQNNGYFPIWHNTTGKNKFSFTIESGAVAMLHIEVYTKGDIIGQSDEFIANAAIPISCLRPGYRNVQLFDANNTRTGPFDFASLLIDIKLKQVVAEI